MYLILILPSSQLTLYQLHNSDPQYYAILIHPLNDMKINICYELIIKLLYIIFHQKRETTERVGSRTNECSTTGQKIHYIAEILREGKLRGLVSFKISMNINGFSKS